MKVLLYAVGPSSSLVAARLHEAGGAASLPACLGALVIGRPIVTLLR